MPYLGPYEMLYFFHLMFYCYQILCFSMPDYLNDTHFFFYSYSGLMKCFFSPSQILCCVYIYIFTGYQMKA